MKIMKEDVRDSMGWSCCTKLMVVRGIGEEAEQIKCDYMFSGYVTITLSFSVINLEGSNGRIYLHLSQISNF